MNSNSDDKRILKAAKRSGYNALNQNGINLCLNVLRAERARTRRIVRQYRKVLDSHIQPQIKLIKQDACDELLRRLN